MIDSAAAIAGVHIEDNQKQLMLQMLNDDLKGYQQVRELHLANSVQPALIFDPVLPGMRFEQEKRPLRLSSVSVRSAPRNIEHLAFATARELSELVRSRKVSSTALTEMYLERLKRYDPKLKFVVTMTDDRARAQAREADREIAAGKYRGPLHGIPWGAKDLLAVKGYRTTWGAAGFENQMIDEDATVVKRLDAAGAVLLCKTTLGALANGDVWFGGKTRNPWDPQDGSSGSSAGSASATAAGCVAFSIGSETLGSISSPSSRCGTTGLRPTFGRIPRTGAMALSWSMDKLGPICRSVEDCAIVLHAINGPDGHDRSVRNAPFNWDATTQAKSMRVAYIRADFEGEEKPKPDEPKPETMTAERRAEYLRAREQRRKDRPILREALQVFPRLGITPTPIELPKLPVDVLQIILLAESAAAFDELTLSGRDKLLTAQASDDWPNVWRVSRFIPAVDYVQANRARTLWMERMAEIFKNFDVVLASSHSDQLTVTNLTGHPALILPDGFRDDGTPSSLTLVGNLYGEEKLLAIGRAYQEVTGFHRKYPKLE
jgi:Asp-tRNA(Asn)/Glu-tRNA(Gln) amidotransferase A subunit family amidase